MITGEKGYLDQIVQTHQCPEHGPKLVVAWHDSENSYVIRCGDGHFPEEVNPIKSRTKEYKVGELAPVGKGLDLLPKTDLATGELLGPDRVHALIIYALKYGLDAFRGHVMIMYGKPYIGIDGYLYHANKQGDPYQLNSKPLTQEEKKTYMIDETDHAWLAEVKMDAGARSFTGLGVVTRKEIEAKSTRDPEQLRSPVVAAHPWQLAQKRAEWQAMRRAFPIGESEEKEEE